MKCPSLQRKHIVVSVTVLRLNLIKVQYFAHNKALTQPYNIDGESLYNL